MTEFEHIERMPRGEEAEFLKDRAIFTLALGRQAELDTQAFDNYEQAQWAAKIAAEEFDSRLHKDTLRNEVVTLRGDEVFMPVATAEPSGSVSLQTDSLSKSALSAPPRVGHFNGFTSFATSHDRGRHYRAVLGYQIDVGWAETPSFSGSLMAYGPVDSSVLEFLKDRQAIDTIEAKSRLLGVEEGESLDNLVNTIDKILSGKDCYNARDIHLVARLIRVHLKRYVKPLEGETKDALLDLVKSKFGLYDDLQFTLEADYTATTRQPATRYNDRGNLAVTLPILGVTFTPYYWIEGGQRYVDSKQDEVSLVVVGGPDNNPQLCTVPFELIRSLEPVLR